MDSATLTSLVQLENLYLNRNHLTSLDAKLLTTNVNLKTLKLDQNKLGCNCELVWLWEFVKTKGGQKVSAFCHLPLNLVNKNLNSLNLADFNCGKYIFNHSSQNQFQKFFC